MNNDTRPSFPKNFNCDDEEIFLRAWWFAHKVTYATLAKYAPTAVSSWFNDERFCKQDGKLLVEVLGYTTSFVLDKLRDEIEASHGWTDETYELHINYQVFLGSAFGKVFELKGRNVFDDMLRDYYLPEYDDSYDDLWGVSSKSDDELSKKTGALERLNELISEEHYEVERYYVYRLSKIVNVADPIKVIDNILPYREIGLEYYDRAFFGLDQETVQNDLINMVNR